MTATRHGPADVTVAAVPNCPTCGTAAANVAAARADTARANAWAAALDQRNAELRAQVQWLEAEIARARPSLLAPEPAPAAAP